MKLLKITLFSAVFFLVNCNSSTDTAQEKTNKENSDISYSESDLNKLQQAEGREIEFLTKQKLEVLIAENELLVFHIDNISDPDFFKIFEKTEVEFEGNFKLVHLISGKKASQSEVNLFIRKNNLASEAFILSDDGLLKSRSAAWQGLIPAVWIFNPKEGIDLLYEQKLSEQELKTILQPVTL